MPRLGGAYCFRRVRSQRNSVDWGTMGPALGGAYECYAHISCSFFSFIHFANFCDSSRNMLGSRRKGRAIEVGTYIPALHCSAKGQTPTCEKNWIFHF